MYKAFQSTRTDVLNHTGNNIALAADCASDDGFARTNTTRSVAVAPMMPILGFPAYESFVHLDDTAELVHVPLDQRGSDLVTHQPSGLVGAEAEETVDLQALIPFLLVSIR